jgi:uncharacterized membrane protein YphA (DoxX/SURF4 family)
VGAVQRLFSTFPAGAPGTGLLLLRAAAGVAAITRGIASLSGHEGPVLLAWIGTAVAIVSGFALLLGLLTPVVGLLAAVAEGALFSGWMPSGAHLASDLLSTSVFVVVALAIVLLGPGAYSLDAYLFGRREIVIPGTGDRRP